MTSEQLSKIISKSPSLPGIYTFKRGQRNLYIGKAANLKMRLHSYLKTADSRIIKMVSVADKVKFETTGSDIEALILESQYIKKYKPDFNIMLRDDKQYGFVGFTHSTDLGQAEKFPKIFITHQPPKSLQAYKPTSLQVSYIGPFTDIGALRTTLRYLRRIFPYCTCKQLHNNYCLNYHIGKCPGICCLKQQNRDKRQGAIDRLTYQKNIKAIKNILNGKKNDLLKNLEKEMVAYGKKDDFEKAIELQNKIEKIKRVFQNARILNINYSLLTAKTNGNDVTALNQLAKVTRLNRPPHRIEAYDIANIQGRHAVGAMVVFTDGRPDNNEYRKFRIYSGQSPDDARMLKEIMTRRFNHPEWPMADLVLVDGGKQQLHIAEVVVNYKFKTPNSKQILNSKSKMPKIVALSKNQKHRGEKIYIAGKANPVPLSQLPQNAKNLILHINSEAHRFAISYYRKLHQGSLKQNKLSDIIIK